MRCLVIISIIALLLGCESRSKQPTASNPVASAPDPFWPLFYRYDLTDYSMATSDVIEGLGGRWISVRFQRHPDAWTTRMELVSRITTAMLADGWTQSPLPQRKYVLSKMWETSPEDIHFERKAKADEPSHWLFAETVFISRDANTVAVYCEVGW